MLRFQQSEERDASTQTFQTPIPFIGLRNYVFTLPSHPFSVWSVFVSHMIDKGSKYHTLKEIPHWNGVKDFPLRKQMCILMFINLRHILTYREIDEKLLYFWSIPYYYYYYILCICIKEKRKKLCYWALTSGIQRFLWKHSCFQSVTANRSRNIQHLGVLLKIQKFFSKLSIALDCSLQ